MLCTILSEEHGATRNRSGIAVEEDVYKPSCSIWIPMEDFRREVSLEDSPYANCNPYTPDSEQQIKSHSAFPCIIHSKASPMIILGLVLLNTKTGKYGLQVAG